MTGTSCDVVGKLPAVSSRSEADTERIGICLAEFAYPGLLVLLTGDLGAGKTALVRAVGAEFGISNVKSPTFSIESVHEIPDERAGISLMIHADLYRLDDAEELSGQFEEELDEGALMLIEWGERWSGAPFANRWDICIERSGENSRIIEMSAFGERALAALSCAYARILDMCP